MTTYTAADFLAPAARELTLQIKGGKAVAELAAELAEEDASGDLTEAQIEEGLWALVVSDLDAAAEAYGQEAAGQASDEQSDEWPTDGAVDVEGVLHKVCRQEHAPRSVTHRIDRAFRAAYAAARA